jgi:hypothetical protein
MAKLDEAETLEEAADMLTRAELFALLSDSRALDMMLLKTSRGDAKRTAPHT